MKARALPWLGLIAAGLLATGTARADMITGVVVGGAGGTATTDIDNSDPLAPTDYFVATFTSLAPIDFAVTIDRPGNFYLSFVSPPGSVLNDTGVAIGALQFQLLDAPAGTFQLGAQQQLGTPLPDLAQSQANYTATISGTPYLQPGQSTAFGVGYNIPTSAGVGPLTYTVRLTPFAVPEPASLGLTAVGLAGVIGACLRRRLVP